MLRFSGEVEFVGVCTVLRIDKVGILESIFGERIGFPLSWGLRGKVRTNLGGFGGAEVLRMSLSWFW
jgi:hypothetical protein